jgi:hypothetical protein
MSDRNGNGHPIAVDVDGEWNWPAILTVLACIGFWIGFLWWILSLVQ